jgi:hypothetical protein
MRAVLVCARKLLQAIRKPCDVASFWHSYYNFCVDTKSKNHIDAVQFCAIISPIWNLM